MKKISLVLVLAMLIMTLVQPMGFVSAETAEDGLKVSASLTKIEFENYTDGWDASASSNTPEPMGSENIVLRANDYVLFNVDVEQDGEYKLLTGISHPSGSTAAPVTVHSDGRFLTTSNIPATSAWYATVEQPAENTFYLTKGNQTIRFASTVDAFFDYFILERVGDAPDNFKSRYDLGINAGGYDASASAATPAGNNASHIFLDADDYVLYNVDIKEAGTYALKICGGNNGTAAGLKVYSDLVQVANGEIAHSGGWLTWAENDFGTVVLTEGETTLKFKASQAAYFLYFTLERIGDVPDTFKMHVEFEDYTGGWDASASSSKPEFSGAANIVLRANDYVLFNVNIPQDGEYKLLTGISHPGGSTAAPVTVHSDGRLLTTSNIPATSAWYATAEQPATNTFYLAKGNQTIRFANTFDAFFDYFILERVGDAPDNFKARYELGINAGGYDASASAATPAGNNASHIFLDANDYVLYNVDVKKAGVYALKVWGGNNGTAAPVNVYQDSELVTSGTIAHSGGWLTWAENDFGTVVLTEGKVTLKFQASQATYYLYFTLERLGDLSDSYRTKVEFEQYTGGLDASANSNVLEQQNADLVILRNGDYGLYEINIHSEGEYKITVGVNHPSGIAETPVSIHLNGELLTKAKVPATGDWFTTVEQPAENTFYLTSGKQTIRISSTSDAFFNYFIVERVGDIPDKFKSRYDLGINAGGYDASAGATTSAGNNASFISLDANDYVLYNIDVKKSGTYALKVWGGNNGTAAPVNVYQDSAILASGVIANSGYWTTWAENDFGTVVLPEGKTTLKFQAGQVAYYLYFTLERIGDVSAEKTINLLSEARQSSYDSSTGKEHTSTNYLSFGTNDTVTFKAVIPADGTYRVIVNAGVKSSAYSAVRLIVDSKTAISSANLINNGDWTTAEQTEIGSITLTKGEHEIKFVGLAEEFWLFGAKLTTAQADGTSVAQADYLIQAENFRYAKDNTEGLDDVSENLVEYSPVEVIEDNGGKVVCFEAGETLEYKLTGIQEAGFYNVKFLMSGANEDYAVKVGVKDGAMFDATVTPSDDGKYSIVTVTDVSLVKGDNNFVVEFVGSEGQTFKLDNITLYKESVTASFDMDAKTATANISLEGLFSGKKVTAILAVYEDGEYKKLFDIDSEEIVTADDFEEITLGISDMKFEEGKTYSAKLFIWNEAIQGNCVEITAE